MVQSSVAQTNPVSSGKLTSKDYWDEILKKAELPRVNTSATYTHGVTMRFIEPFIRGMGFRTLLEIGCGSSGWLPYFAREYGLRVSGLDYSEIGCQLARKNLAMLEIPYDEVICSDVLQWNSTEKYDIIFTYGVIEHFQSAGEILTICHNHLNDGGMIITLVPNIHGPMKLLNSYFAPGILAMHVRYTCESLRDVHFKAGFVDVATKYVGHFSLGMVPWEKVEKWPFTPNSFSRKVSFKVLNALDKLLHKTWSTLGWDARSRSLSPYIISVMRKAKI
jgi:2-polyprenyl-3-methyl-5-hydroxy-6-metoxy-1,4-benzoquinol methylase